MLILIGHGSYDGLEYKFNLVGPDMTGTEIASLCDRSPRTANLSSILPAPAAVPSRHFERPGRAVIAATKSGREERHCLCAVLGGGVQDPSADTDKSGSVSAMEAFTYAARKDR